MEDFSKALLRDMRFYQERDRLRAQVINSRLGVSRGRGLTSEEATREGKPGWWGEILKTVEGD